MEQQALHNFLHRYFDANDCSILQDVNGVMEVQLTDEIDEMLMNRPFYWHYVKRMGGQGMPMKVTFITNPEKKEEKGEWIHFGSPRLHQMFHSLKEKGRITRQYEKVETTNGQLPLAPWLILNASIHYKGTQKRNEVLSIGLHLINGGMVLDIMDQVQDVPLTPVINDYCFTLSPIIKVPSAFKRIEQYLNTHIDQQDYEWCKEADRQLEEEKQLLQYFYSEDLLKEDEHSEEIKKRYDAELGMLEDRFKPSVSLEVINAGLMYFTQETSMSFFQHKN